MQIFLLVITMLISALFMSTFAQTFPPLSSCTSKDLELVSATLPPPGNDPCACGGTRTLMLGIYNKTGSTRTSFALWGTLVRYNAQDVEIAREAIFACAATIPKNATTILPSNRQITVSCGESLEIIDLYLAWTSASPNETCAMLEANPSTINPKCGTLPRIQVDLGVDASLATTNASCTSTGQIVVSPFGGRAPYIISLPGTTPRNVIAGASTTYTGLAAGTYTFTITDANNCSTEEGRTISQPDQVSTPAATVTQPTCSVTTATVNVTSPSSTITYTLEQENVVIHTANSSGVFNLVAEGTYVFRATRGTCNTTGNNVIVNAPPVVPGTPAATVNHPTCTNAAGTVTITPTSYNSSYTYTLTKNGTTYTAVDGVFSSVAAGTYSLTATLGNCSTSGNNVVVNTQPPTPNAPSFTVIQPSLCNNNGGSITICNPVSGYTYYIVGGNYTITANGGTVAFTGLAAGSNPSVRVRTPDGCVSQATNCGDAVSTCGGSSRNPGTDVQENNVTTQQINIPASRKLGIKAFPNPYNDVIRFVINSEESGQGRLELFNVLGQKVKTVYQGRIAKGVQNFQTIIPAQHRSTLIYVMTLNGKQFTGKLLNSSK